MSLTAESKTMHHADQLPHAAHDVTTSALFGASCVWSLCVAVWKGLPSWELVPPILFGVVALSREFRAWKKAKG